MPKKNSVCPVMWDYCADLYEVGYKNGRQIAALLGVSPQTVMREMKKRGVTKGLRAYESVRALEAELDHRKLEREREDNAEWFRNWDRFEALTKAIGVMVAALEEAVAVNDFSHAREVTSMLADRMGVKLRS
jgi:DNA-binding Lrp family transcriptional regulator